MSPVILNLKSKVKTSNPRTFESGTFEYLVSLSAQFSLGYFRQLPITKFPWIKVNNFNLKVFSRLLNKTFDPELSFVSRQTMQQSNLTDFFRVHAPI